MKLPALPALLARLKPVVIGWFEGLPFRIKLALLASASTLLALVFMAVITGLLVWWAHLESARYQAAMLRPLMSAALTGPMIEHDYAGVEEMVRALVSQDGIQEMTVRGPDGRVIVSVTAPEGVDGLLAAAQTVVFTERGLRFGEVTLHYVTGKVGVLLTGLMWTVVALVPLAIGLGVWVFRGWAARLTSGLEQLAQSAAALAAGDLSVRSRVRGGDEIGALSRAFNHMATYLEKQFRALRQAEHDQRQLAERDPLTGLYNRRAFDLALEQRLELAQKSGRFLALMYIDLDEFKDLNDNLGHAAGDAMLIQIGANLSESLNDGAVCARLGGDEFGVLSWVGSEAGALTLAQHLLDHLRSSSLEIRGSQIRLTGSVGVAVAPMHGLRVSELSVAADTAMYRAKSSGRNAVRIYQASTHVEGLARLDWNQRLYRALEKDLFELRFQGIWRPDRSLSHVEVLLRLRDEDNPQHLYMPMQFIGHAERSGIIREIDRWVFRTVAALLTQHDFKIAVNVSARTIKAGGFDEFVAGVIDEFKVDPARIIIEITETSALGDLVEAQLFVRQLQQLGCGIALDDFGSGYSSFAYLRHLRADLVKVDGQFVEDLQHHQENQILVKAIADAVRMSRGITVAEYVEDQAAAEMLPGLGVQLMQGFWFDRPASLTDFLLMMQRSAVDDGHGVGHDVAQPLFSA
jgi:diguanylate cyclase (GGDEF)-like protein